MAKSRALEVQQRGRSSRVEGVRKRQSQIDARRCMWREGGKIKVSPRVSRLVSADRYIIGQSSELAKKVKPVHGLISHRKCTGTTFVFVLLTSAGTGVGIRYQFSSDLVPNKRQASSDLLVDRRTVTYGRHSDAYVIRSPLEVSEVPELRQPPKGPV